MIEELPRRLGAYVLIRRLGEGGMGTVYLGRHPDGRQVAVKVIRPDRASDEFRARFRSEVTRARQVPPYCTAEVLDADPDHETPYLVSEYIDGPTLADKIVQSGPMTGGTLHSLAIGTAAALMGIHRAGVIHRDFKPANVLLALGAPRVIDFGIAKAVEATDEHTLPGHLVGTIACTAPERLDPGRGAVIGPAVDVFSWGALVVYAASGRYPFQGDAELDTPMQILTRDPYLGPLTGILRDLVARSLDKDPAKRPTTPQLLDTLLTAGADGDAAVVAGLISRPDVRHAAEAARSRGRHSRPTTTSTPGPRRRARTRSRLLLTAAAAAITVAGSAALVHGRDLSGADPEARAARPEAPAPSPEPVVADDQSLNDSFNRSSDWRASRGGGRTSCATVDGVLLVTREATETVRCDGTDRAFTDHTIVIDVRPKAPDACAVTWTRVLADTGIRVTVCPEKVALSIDHDTVTEVIDTAKIRAAEGGQWHHVEIDVTGHRATVAVNGNEVASGKVDRGPARGKVMLGLTSGSTQAAGGQAAFANLEIRPS